MSNRGISLVQFHSLWTVLWVVNNLVLGDLFKRVPELWRFNLKRIFAWIFGILSSINFVRYEQVLDVQNCTHLVCHHAVFDGAQTLPAWGRIKFNVFVCLSIKWAVSTGVSQHSQLVKFAWLYMIITVNVDQGKICCEIIQHGLTLTC